MMGFEKTLRSGRLYDPADDEIMQAQRKAMELIYWASASCSVVTKDIPSDVVAVGNPCRVLRPISERNKEYYFISKIKR